MAHAMERTDAEIPVARTKIFGISVSVSDYDRDKQPSYEYCGEGTKWF